MPLSLQLIICTSRDLTCYKIFSKLLQTLGKLIIRNQFNNQKCRVFVKDLVECFKLQHQKSNLVFQANIQTMSFVLTSNLSSSLFLAPTAKTVGSLLAPIKLQFTMNLIIRKLTILILQHLCFWRWPSSEDEI